MRFSLSFSKFFEKLSNHLTLHHGGWVCVCVFYITTSSVTMCASLQFFSIAGTVELFYALQVAP